MEHIYVIEEGHLLPGNCVSTDQFECRIKGWLPSSCGKEDPHKIYSGGTLFVDHASGVIKVYHQVSVSASDKVKSKELYKMWASEFGINVKTYRGYNGV